MLRRPWIAIPALAASVLLALVLVLFGLGSTTKAASQATPRPPDASLDPPPDAIELCSGHEIGAPLPDGRPGAHISWTVYTSTETRHSLAVRYQEALGDEGHTAESDCDTWRRPPERPARILDVCELEARGPWDSCSSPPEKAKSRILVSTMARAD